MSGPSTATTGRPTGLGANYWKLWTASAISNLGDGIDATALPLLAAALTRDPLLFAGVAVAARLPWLLFALQSGAIADRVDRRRLMAHTNLVRFALMGVLGVAVLTGWASIWLLYAVAFLLGIAETLFDNASQAIMPALVPRDQLETANGRLFAAEIATNQFVGPPLGGLLFAVLAALPILLDAGTFAISAGLIFAVTGSFTTRAATEGPRQRLRRDIRVGLTWLWRHRLLRTLGLMLGLANGMGMVVFAIFPLFALDVVGVNEVGLGLLFTAGAVGSVLGSLVAARVVARIGRGPALIGSVVGFGAPLIVVAAWPDVLVVGAAQAVIGFASVVWNVITVSLRQTIIPDALLGRVNSVYRFLGWGSMPLGSLLGGVLAREFGLRTPFVIAGVVQLVALVVILPIVNTRTIEEARRVAATDT
ncbi:MAG TPA: MFS transporter [Nitriliruptorales bacterium]|nr:MFS transporter [Nitriliruptorales bacterium]